jgi:hypothetical protein
MISFGRFMRPDPVNPIPGSGVKYWVSVSGGKWAYFYVGSAMRATGGMAKAHQAGDDRDAVTQACPPAHGSFQPQNEMGVSEARRV